VKQADTRTNCLTKVSQLKPFVESNISQLERVEKRFAFRCSQYYASLINWSDPKDPIRQLIIPNRGELQEWGTLDPSDEQRYTILPGLEHKYSPSVLLLVSNNCEGICRYCFRKQVFMKSPRHILQDIPGAMAYIQSHPEVNNVLLSGGDPLTLSTRKLETYTKALCEIDNVQVIRIGTKVPAFNPLRITQDPSLSELITRTCEMNRKVYVITHFSHPRELTDTTLEAIDILQKAGAILSSQTPLIRGINDNAEVLSELLQKLVHIGVIPYYIFKCRPALGNRPYVVSIEEGCDIISQIRSRTSGLAKRIRYIMSHATGKIEILGTSDEYVFFQYHSISRDRKAGGGVFVHLRDCEACWLSDYKT